MTKLLGGPLGRPVIQQNGECFHVVTSNSPVGETAYDTLVATAGAGEFADGISNGGTLVVPFVPMLVQQDLAGAGAVTLTEYYTAWTTGGAVAGTLADGTVVGQLKRIRSLTADEGTLTFNVDDTIVFTDAGDTALLLWDGSDWIPIELSNDADGATAPVYATS
jgi:hypothetical protein